MSDDKYDTVVRTVKEQMTREDLPEWQPTWRQLPAPVTARRVPPDMRQFFRRIGLKVRHVDGTQEVNKRNAPEYDSRTDDIRMPPVQAFSDPDAYRVAAFHEAVHWSGDSPERALRATYTMERMALLGLLPTGVGRLAKAHEEIIAELGAAFLAEAMGVKWHPERVAHYVRGFTEPFNPTEKEWIVTESVREAKLATEWLLTRNTEPKGAQT